MIEMTVDCVGQAVVADVDHHKEILSTDRFTKRALGLT